MERCRSIRGVLVPYVDGAVDVGAQRAVETHVRACSRCRRELDELRQLTLLLQAALSIAPRAPGEARESLAGVRRRIDGLRHARRSPLAFWRRVLEEPLTAIAALLVAFVAVGEALIFLELDEEVLDFVASYLLPLVLS